MTVENCEFSKNFHYFITIEIEGDSVKRRTDVSAQVTNPVFQTNTFFVPITDTRLQKNPSLVISAFVITNRID